MNEQCPRCLHTAPSVLNGIRVKTFCQRLGIGIMSLIKALMWIPVSLLIIAPAFILVAFFCGLWECWDKNQWPWEMMGS